MRVSYILFLDLKSAHTLTCLVYELKHALICIQKLEKPHLQEQGQGKPVSGQSTDIQCITLDLSTTETAKE